MLTENALTDEALADLRRRFAPIYTGAITDTLYGLGLGAQTLPTAIKPLVKGQRVAGLAFPVEWVSFATTGEVPEDRAWEMLGAVPAGHVAICCNLADDRSALGDLAMAYLKARGCAGVVMDGGARDVDFNEAIGLPTFCAFATPQDMSHGRGGVERWGHEVTVGEVRIAPGDFVVGDADGVVVIPIALVDTVLERCEALVALETRAREALLAGASPEEALAEFTEAPVAGAPVAHEVHRSTTTPSEGWEAFDLATVSGDPQGRASLLVDRARDGLQLEAGIFTAEPSVYELVQPRDEIIMILEGSVRIELDDGQVLDLKVGDTASISRGVRATWHILEPFREFYVLAGSE